MRTFKEHCDIIDEGIVRSLFDSEYRSLPPKIRRDYDMMDQTAHAAIQQSKEAKKISLLQAIQEFMAEAPARAQWKKYNQMAGSERQAYGVKPSQYNFGLDSTGQKPYRP